MTSEGSKAAGPLGMSGSVGRILTGLRIVELSAFVAGPLAGATLAELGADVIRIDPPGGGIDANRWPLHEGHSLYWAGLNRGKRSVTLDSTSAIGQQLVTDLIVRAGMVLTNLPVQEWMSYERLKERRSDLIMAVISGNPDGTPAVDYTVNAAVGYPWVTGPEGSEAPVNHVLPSWDGMTGYLAAAGILSSQLHRMLTGEGQLINLSLSDVALSFTSHLGFMAEAQLNPEPRQRYGNYIFGSFGRDFTTSDGRHLMLVALTPRQWESLVETTGLRQQLAAIEGASGLDLRLEGNRFRLRDEISALLEPWIAARTYERVKRLFDGGGVLWAPYQTFKELVAHDWRASSRNPMVGEIRQPGIGRHLAAGSPLAFSGFNRTPPARAPLIGEDTRQVLESWLGLSGGEMDGLEKQGVIDSTP